MFLRSPRSPCNVASHLNDLSYLLNSPATSHKSVLFLVVDGGPDFNSNFAINTFYYGRFFFRENLDAFVITQYCPGHSAYNPVEHLWAPCTQALTSVYLPNTLPGEALPPCQQSNLQEGEKEEKEHQVFNEAMRRIKDSYWRDLTFAGRTVNVAIEPSGSPPNPYGQEYIPMKEKLSCSATKMKREHGAVLKEQHEHSQHLDRRIGTLIFTKCTKCEHCKSNPVRCSQELMDTLRNFPSPFPSEVHEEHFVTFKEALAAPRTLPCQHLPQYHAKDLGRCQVNGCKYTFTSKSDATDHKRKIHIRN